MQQAWRAPTHISLAIRLPWLRSNCSPLLHRISSHNVEPVNARTNVAGEIVAEQKVIGLPARLDFRQQLQYRQHGRRLLLACGAGAQEGCAITLFKPPWPILPSLSVFSSYYGRSSGQIRCSSYSPIWKLSSLSASTSDACGHTKRLTQSRDHVTDVDKSVAVNSVETQTVEQLWELYFADASQWWDNRVDKKNPRSPDFKHKVTRRALWIEGWSTPAWVKARLKLVTQGTLQRHAGYGTRDSQETALGERSPNGKNGKGKTVAPSARELRQSVQGSGGSMHLQSASTTSEAISMLKNRLKQGLSIEANMYVEVLKRCVKEKDLTMAKQVHECIIKSAMDQNTYVANSLLSLYIKCGRLQDARLVFDGLVKKDVYSWTIMIGGYAQLSRAEDAMGLFNRSRQEKVQVNEITYLSILKACTSPSALKWGKEVHAHIRDDGFESDVRVGTALMKMYAKCGCMEEARQAFEKLTNRDVISWTVMIGGYAESGCGEEAYQLLLQMKREGFTPNAITYTSILNACASTRGFEWVKEVHRHVVEAGLESDLRLSNALVHMYAKSGCIDEARIVFDRMEKRDVITWTVMIGAYAECGCREEAYRLFLQMKREGFTPNAITYLSILNASSSTPDLEWVKEVHRDVVEGGFESNLSVCNAIVHMYSKCGCIDEARLVFDRMEKHDVITWTVMIGAYAESGCGEEAYRLFLQMKREGVKPDAITYLSILNSCASAGALEWVEEVHKHVVEAGLESNLRVGNALVHMYAKSGSIDDARLVFHRMENRDVVTWNIMIGGLAQHGCVHDALEVFRKMNAEGVKPDGLSFVAVLSACSHAGLVDEGRRLFLAMSEDYGIEPTIFHYTCMVDLVGRAGHLEEAKLIIGNMPVEPNVAIWGALLSACRTYGDVELGELAATELLKLEPEDASTYVLLSNIYAGAGMWEEVSLVRSWMEERGIRKEPGRSWIEVDNKIHGFGVGDTSHLEVKNIYAELNRLTERIKAEGYIPDTRQVLENVDVEDKEVSLCSHSEKLAIAYGLMHTPDGKPIRVYKNLRVCSDCHTATKFISKVTGREILARDANRFHHFKDGVCSCGDYW